MSGSNFGSTLGPTRVNNATIQGDHMAGPGRVHRGTVLEYDTYSRTYTVQIEDPVTIVTGLISAVGVCAGLIGVRTNVQLTPGTGVLTAGPFIFATFDRAPGVGSGISVEEQARSVGVSNPDERTQGLPDMAPADLYPGELDISLLTGTALQLLTSMARLKAGDLAIVEANMMNDMVRILSRNFRQHSSLHDCEIYSERGAVNGKWRFVATETEGWGAAEAESGENAPKVADVNSEVTVTEAETMRSRLDLWLGYAGDFMSLFLQDPVKTLGKFGEIGYPKLKMHINADGSFVLQGMGDIVLEQTSGIVVATEADSGADRHAAAVSNGHEVSVHEALFAASATDNPIALAHSLRSYARWLADEHVMHRFRADDRFSVKPEQPPENPFGSGASDKEAVAPPYRRSYATVRMNRDGSVNILGGDGCSLLFGNGSGHLSVAKDLDIEAGGNLRLRAGRNLLMLARGHVELTALLGSIVSRAKLAWRAIAEAGVIHLRSDKVRGDAPLVDPETGQESDEFLPDTPGILLEAQQERAVFVGGRGFDVQCDSQSEPNFFVTGVKAFVLHAELVRVQGAGHLSVVMDSLSAAVRKTIGLRAPEAISLNDGLVVEGGSADPQGRGRGIICRLTTYMTRALYAASRIYGPPQLPTPAAGGEGVKPHLNHILENKLDAGAHDTPWVGANVLLQRQMVRIPRIPARLLEWTLGPQEIYESTDGSYFATLSDDWDSQLPEEDKALRMDIQDMRLEGPRIRRRDSHFPQSRTWRLLGSSAPNLDKPAGDNPVDTTLNITDVVISLRYHPRTSS